MRPPQDNQLKTTPATAEPIRPQLTSQPVQDKFAGQPKETNLWQFSEARSHRQTQLNQHLWPGVDEFFFFFSFPLAWDFFYQLQFIIYLFIYKFIYPGI